MSRFGLATVVLVLLLGSGVYLMFRTSGEADPEAGETTVTTATPGSEPTVLAGEDPKTTTTAGTTTQPSTTPTSSSSSSSTTSTTSTTTTIATTTTMPPFTSSISTPTADMLYASWEPGCPVGPSELRLVTLSHWNYAGGVSTGELVVAAGLAGDIVAIFEDLYEAGFPIERMELVDNYGGDDNASMAANNTSAFNCRLVTGGTTYSEHSYGRAIDVNPLVNPYVNGSTILPPAGEAYADRSLDVPGMIHAGDEVVQAFGARGWIWGGTWTSLQDYQHFSTTGK